VPDSKPAGRHLLVSGTNLIYRIEFHSHASEEEANPAVPQPSGSQSEQSLGQSLGQPSSDLGANEWLVEEMFDQYQRDPQSVDPVWIAYFKASPPGNGSHAAPAATSSFEQKMSWILRLEDQRVLRDTSPVVAPEPASPTRCSEPMLVAKIDAPTTTHPRCRPARK